MAYADAATMASARSILGNTYVHAAVGALVAVAVTGSGAFAAIVGLGLLAGRYAYDKAGSPQDPDLSGALLTSLTERGADYADASSCDRKAIGYDVAGRTILFAVAGERGAVSVSEHPLDLVREVAWRVETPDQTNVYGVGTAALAGRVQAASMNAVARHQALMRSGLDVALADVEVPVLHICLDGDEVRMRRWTEILDQAREGTLRAPSAPSVPAA